MSAITATATGPGPDADDLDLRQVARKPLVRRVFSSTGAWVFVIDLVLIAIFTVLSPSGAFLSLSNVQSILMGGTEALLLALGLALMMGSGLIDFSLGANLVLSSITGALVIQRITGEYNAEGVYPHLGWAIVVGFVVAVLTGMAFGAVNGLVTAYLQVNAFIATLGTMGIGLGLALVITRGGNVTGLPIQLSQNIGARMVGGAVPLTTLVALVLAVGIYALIRFTRFGMRSMALGSSKAAADRAGIKTKSHALKVAIIAGSLCGIAGFVDLSRFGGTTTSGHGNDALNAVTAVIIGGTLLQGGRVSIIGTIWGTVLAVVLQNGLVVIGVQPYYQQIAVGVVLIAAVTVDRFRTLRQRS